MEPKYPLASEEPLDDIEKSTCKKGFVDETALRFRAAFNEIHRLRAESVFSNVRFSTLRQEHAKIRREIADIFRIVGKESGTTVLLLGAVKMAYRKHHLDDPAIGWDELGDALMAALMETMGDAEFQKWVEGLKK